MSPQVRFLHVGLFMLPLINKAQEHIVIKDNRAVTHLHSFVFVSPNAHDMRAAA